MSTGLTIGALALQTDVKVATIRYYEEIGLMPKADRTEGGQRRYGASERDRLAFIRHARDLGFSVEDIRGLLALQDNPSTPCDLAHELAARQVAAIERRIRQLAVLKDELTRIADSCKGGRMAADCRVIHALADHGQCAHEHAAHDRIAAGPAVPAAGRKPAMRAARRA
jgi:DNA-binding transcriptional MerR regulator